MVDQRVVEGLQHKHGEPRFLKTYMVIGLMALSTDTVDTRFLMMGLQISLTSKTVEPIISGLRGRGEVIDEPQPP